MQSDPLSFDPVLLEAARRDREERRAPQSQPEPQPQAAPAIRPEKKQDRYIWAIFIALCLFSVIELYSASSREVVSGNVYAPIVRHLSMLVAGAAIAYGVSRIPYRFFSLLTPLLFIGSVVMMVYVLFYGEIINGARRSFNMGIAIQPSEFLKLSAVMVIALVMSRTQLSKREGVKNQGVIISAGVVLLIGGLLFTQGLTNTILMMAISLSMLIVGGIQFKKLAAVLVAYCIIAGAGYLYKSHNEQVRETEYAVAAATAQGKSGSEATPMRSKTWKSRLSSFFDDTPKYEREITAKNRQEMYAYMAQANGGAFGVLPGNSRETARLPLAFSDYIFSIVVEDLGFIGGVVLIIIYLSLLARAGNLASHCSHAFPALLVMGCAVMIAYQALFHMAIVTGVFPVSGQPLPLISKGGTSILITSIAFGIMLSVSRNALVNGKPREVREESDSLPEDIRSLNPTQLT